MGKRCLRGFVQVQLGSVSRHVEKPCHVVTILVSRYVMQVLVVSVLDQEAACAHVENQRTRYPVLRMSLHVGIAVIEFWSVEYTSAPSAVTEGNVKPADRKSRSSVAVENTQNACLVTSLIYVKPNVLKLGIARDISARENVVLETARHVTSSVDVR